MSKVHDLINKLTDWRDSQSDDDVTLDSAFNTGKTLNDVFSYGLTSDEIQDAVDELMQIRVITQDLGTDVTDNSGHIEWYEEWAKESLENTRRWTAYNALLSRKGWSSNVRDTLNKETSRIVDLMGDPNKPGAWARRGLVIGEVQSGKTATYIGVLNKALDAGYQFVVILGGHTNDLRKQTQERVDSDLVGKDSSLLGNHIDQNGEFQNQRIGIGKENLDLRTQVLTTVDSDFNRNSKIATTGITIGGDPMVAIIKKRAQTIKNLRTYLQRQSEDGIIDESIAVIDDEADWASVNTRRGNEAAAVNREIRALLNVAKRSSYMAITATPFANILIDHENADDLFPRNYIRALNAPSNYQGVETYLTNDARSSKPEVLQVDVDDVLSVLPFRHKRNATFPEVPSSLREAIATFILASAIRRARGHVGKPSSMMINISRFNGVQKIIHQTVGQYIVNLNNIIQAGIELGTINQPREVQELRATLAIRYPNIEDTNWPDLVPHFKDVLHELTVELINGTTMAKRKKMLDEYSREDLEAYEAKPKIFIGGNILARGLTLEGLVVSYYLRKTAAADTLLQMGRWFGYRPGYEDLVRIWTDEEIISHFEYAAEISASLRRSIRTMNDKKLTPEQFGLAIEQHPESFRITALNKSRNAEEIVQDVRVFGHVFESYMLPRNHELLMNNVKAAGVLANTLAHEFSDCKESTSAIANVWRRVPVSVVKEFLSEFKGHAADPYFGTTNRPDINKLVDALEDTAGIEEWNIAFIGGQSEKTMEFGSSGTVRINMADRNKFEQDTSDESIQFGNRRVSTANDLFNSLSSEEIERLKEAGLEKQRSQQNVIDNVLQNPTLMIYGVDGTYRDTDGQPIGTDIVASVVAFPHREGEYTGKSKTIKVLANTVYMKNLRTEAISSTDDDENYAD